MAAFDARELMEMAVEVMRCSVSEPRSDGKASPLVGAVLWRPGGTIDTACRGELRAGDHAEFTVLERKNLDRALDDAVLFATLEPCAPGSRAHPKLSCAERIVLARIREVWIGIEDPDPAVDRKGIQHLQDNGITVHIFDRDLQETIREENASFIDRALERALAAEEEPQKAVTLSPLEGASPVADMADLSNEALERYREVAGITDELGSPGFARRLALQGLLIEANGRLMPSGFGVLLFGREPRGVIPQAGILATMHLPDGREETADFDGPQVLAADDALQWLRDKLPDPIDRSKARRRRANDAFFVLVREGLVNALVHRDYDISGAKCQLIAGSDVVTIKSPGGPPSPITLQQMQSFRAPMLSRNPIVHYVFALRVRADGACRRAWAGHEVHEGQCREGGSPAADLHLGRPISGVDDLRHVCRSPRLAHRRRPRGTEQGRARGVGMAREAPGGDRGRVCVSGRRAEAHRAQSPKAFRRVGTRCATWGRTLHVLRSQASVGAGRPCRISPSTAP